MQITIITITRNENYILMQKNYLFKQKIKWTVYKA